MDLVKLFPYLVSLFTVLYAQRDKQMYCAVCRVMVDEMSWSISQVDPKKTIQTGSYRVDPHGNQNIKAVPYARSETHISEVVEEVCKNMNNYAQTTQDDGKKNIVRTSSRNGKPLSLKNIDINRDIQKQLGFYCDTLIEEYEEEIIAMFRRQERPDIEKVICEKISRACSEAELNEPMATLKAEEEFEQEQEEGEEAGEENGEENGEEEDVQETQDKEKEEL